MGALSDQRFAAVFNQASVGVVQTTLEGKILYSNRFHASLLGYTVEELAGRDVADLVHPDDRAEGRALMQTHLASGRGFQRTQRVLRKDGALCWLHQTATPLTDAGGRPDSMLWVSVDMTERRYAEMAMQRSEERLRLIVENARDYAIFTTDPEDRIDSWLPGAANIFGWSAEEAVGQCRVVERRFFAGLSVEETAEALGISAATVKRDWATARLWLYNELESG